MASGHRYGEWILLVPAAVGLAWVASLGYQGLNGQDAHDYLRIARAWQSFFEGGQRPLMAEHPHGYPLLAALLGYLVGPLWALRIISIVAFVTMAVMLHRLLRDHASDGPVARSLAFLGIALSPFLLRYALTTMSDVLALAFTTAAFSAALTWMRTRGSRSLVAVILWLSLALFVRLAVAPIAMLLLTQLVLVRNRVRIGPRTLAIAVTGIVVAGSVLIAMWQQDGKLAGTPLAEWSPLNWFRRTLRSDDGVLHYMFPNILYAFGVVIHPGHFTVGLLILPFFRWKDLSDPCTRSAAVLLVGYLLFVAGMPFQNDRVLLLALPFTVVVFRHAFARAWAALQGRGYRPLLAVMVLALLQGALFIRAMLPFIRQAQVERELSAFALELAPSHLYTHGMGAALNTYCPGVPVTELWYARIDRFDHGAVLVVHPANLAEQWSGLFPAINWSTAQEAGAVTVHHRADGWVIARVP